MGFKIQNGILKKYIDEDGATDIVIPEGVRQIGKLAFSGCGNLKHIIIPESVECIGENAFRYCDGLSSITIPDSVTTLGEGVFDCCRGLQHVTLPKNITIISKDMFAGCFDLVDVSIPDNVISIHDKAFYACNHLKKIIIPEGVTEIGEEAFLGCHIPENVSIPEKVTTIGNNAFSLCYRLENIFVSEKNVHYYSEDGVLYDRHHSALVCCPNGKKIARIRRDVPEILDTAFEFYYSQLETILITDSRADAPMHIRITRDFKLQDLISVMQENYTKIKDVKVKYQTALYDYLHDLNEEAGEIVRKSLSRIMTMLIDDGDAESIERLLTSRKVTVKQIDKWIEYAIAQQQTEIQLILLNYKNEHIGYQKQRFRL